MAQCSSSSSSIRGAATSPRPVCKCTGSARPIPRYYCCYFLDCSAGARRRLAQVQEHSGGGQVPAGSLPMPMPMEAAEAGHIRTSVQPQGAAGRPACTRCAPCACVRACARHRAPLVTCGARAHALGWLRKALKEVPTLLQSEPVGEQSGRGGGAMHGGRYHGSGDGGDISYNSYKAH